MRRTREQLAKLLEGTRAAAQRDIPAGNLRDQVPNRNLAPLQLTNPDLFSGLLLISRGGTSADLSGTGPGVLVQAGSGSAITSELLGLGYINWASTGTHTTGQTLIYDNAGPSADFGPLNLSLGSPILAGLLSPTFGGTGVNNGSRNLTIATNGGTLAFSASGKTLTISETLALTGTSSGFTLTVPATGTAALRASAATAGRVGFWSSATDLSHDANLTWDSANARFHVGAVPAIDVQALSIASANTAAGTAYMGALIEHTFTSASNLTTTQRGLSFSAYLDGSGGATTGNAIGIIGEAQNRQTAGTVSLLVGASIGARLTNAGNVTTGWGVAAIPVLSGAGNLTTWYDFYARSPSRTSTGSITTSVGLQIDQQNVTGVTTGYGVNQVSATDLNHFAGAIDMPEQAAPAAPAASVGRLFVRDNGAGKTQLCVIFNTGVLQVIATQP